MDVFAHHLSFSSWCISWQCRRIICPIRREKLKCRTLPLHQGRLRWTLRLGMSWSACWSAWLTWFSNVAQFEIVNFFGELRLLRERPVYFNHCLRDIARVRRGFMASIDFFPLQPFGLDRKQSLQHRFLEVGLIWSQRHPAGIVKPNNALWGIEPGWCDLWCKTHRFTGRIVTVCLNQS